MVAAGACCLRPVSLQTMAEGTFAEVPSLKDPGRDATDFAALNKALRACHVCRLIKSDRQVSEPCCWPAQLEAGGCHGSSFLPNPCRLQFLESGCDNCVFLSIAEDRDKLNTCTTPNFSGYAHRTRGPVLLSGSQGQQVCPVMQAVRCCTIPGRTAHTCDMCCTVSG